MLDGPRCGRGCRLWMISDKMLDSCHHSAHWAAGCWRVKASFALALLCRAWLSVVAVGVGTEGVTAVQPF